MRFSNENQEGGLKRTSPYLSGTDGGGTVALARGIVERAREEKESERGMNNKQPNGSHFYIDLGFWNALRFILNYKGFHFKYQCGPGWAH